MQNVFLMFVFLDEKTLVPSTTKVMHHSQHTPQPFYDPFSGTTRVSQCQKRTVYSKQLTVKINNINDKSWQVIKVIWHNTAKLLQIDGSIIFATWRQCALPCGHIGATWRIWLNLCFLWPTHVHNPNSISIGSAVFAQMTAQCPYLLQWDAPSLSQNCPFPWGYVPHLIHGSLGQPESSTQTASRSVQSFLQGSLVWQTDRPGR